MQFKKKLGEILLESQVLSKEQFEKALAGQKESGLKLGQYLVRKGIIKETQLADVLSKQLNVQRYLPDKYPFDDKLSKIVPAEMAQKSQLVPIELKATVLRIAMPDPLDIRAIDSVEIYTNLEVEPIICTEKELQQLISSVYGLSSSIGGIIESIEDIEIKTQQEQNAEDIQVSSLQDLAGEAPTVRLVNSIITQAVRDGASDVHISPEAQYVSLRFRIDGKLHEMPSPPKQMFMSIVSRIKILAQLDISNNRIPQDGRFTVRLDKKEVNIRVSTLPTIYGENIVMRLLDSSAGVYTLEQLGMSEISRKHIDYTINLPHGMTLSNGPTGSGKTTSLYSILNLLNKPDINIITVEDPVEYRMEKIRQVQLNIKAGMNFAGSLRSILRQDPDVIMVGEIRDKETAGVAVQAALTGHKVLSTIHTNDATGAITRLINMEIEPFLIASVLNVSFAQRLVRTICPHCKEIYQPRAEVLKFWGFENISSTKFFKGRGCQQCLNTGYKGRTGIHEVLVIDDDIKTMIVKNMSATEIYRASVEMKKLIPLRNDAAQKILQGFTTFEEATSAVMT